MKWSTDIYNIPAYSVVDVARYLHIPTATLRSWLSKRSYSTKDSDQNCYAPLIQRPDPDSPQLSFINLIEAHVLHVIRRVHNIRLDKVRRALDYLSDEIGTSHPLARVEFQTDGVDLFVESFKQLINASRSGQLAMRDTLNHLLTRIEWDKEGIAARFFPFVQPLTEAGPDKPLVIDPRISFGRPILVGTGVPTKIIAELYDAGDSIEDIAHEYDCTVDQIHTAIWFESQAQAA